MKTPVGLRSLLACAALAFPAAAQTQAPAARSTTSPVATAGCFAIKLDARQQSEPYSGRIYLALSTDGEREPRERMGDWFGGDQVFAREVRELAASESVAIDTTCLAFPRPLGELKGGEYFVQAVARRSLDSPRPGHGAGDLYSEPVKIRFVPGDSGRLELTLGKMVAEKPFQETERVKLFEMVSPSLTAFYGRPVKIRAGVLLPASWRADSAAKHATVYFITGFGGDHRQTQGLQRLFPKDGPSADVLIVVPDPSCRLGHSVFADSANNGPRGKALVEELIPALEARFHGAESAERRYVTGISSGGWSSLWLQVTYPDVFNGCWSHCPDPVDFRDFQRIDLYEPKSNFYREHGERRPLARMGREVMLWYDDFVRQETVMGPGGQIHSFEAVFSERGDDGEPESLFDRSTGEVDTDVARTWEKYDIRLVLERQWRTLGPKLEKKLHIYAGELDTFYLEGAVRLLKDSLAELGSDAEVVIVPGMAHTVYQPGMQAMFRTIAEGQR